MGLIHDEDPGVTDSKEEDWRYSERWRRLDPSHNTRTSNCVLALNWACLSAICPGPHSVLGPRVSPMPDSHFSGFSEFPPQEPSTTLFPPGFKYWGQMSHVPQPQDPYMPIPRARVVCS